MKEKIERKFISEEFQQGIFFVDRIKYSAVNYVSSENMSINNIWSNVGEYIGNAIGREIKQRGNQKAKNNK